MSGSYSFRATVLLVSTTLLTGACDSLQPDVNRKIRKEVDELLIADTHEHFPPESARQGVNADFFSLVIGYLQADMLSSGMKNEQLDSMLNVSNSFGDRWRIFDAYWKNSKHTGYGRCLSLTVEGLFGVKDLDEESGRFIDRKMKDSNNAEGWYRYILREKSRIGFSIVDPLGANADTGVRYPCDLFVKVRRFDNFTTVNRKNITGLGRQYGIKIRNLADYITVLDSAFSQAVNLEGIVGIKSGLAYGRKMYFEDVPEKEAADIFERVMDSLKTTAAEEANKLADFMFHQIAAMAGKYDLPFQIHTGILSRNYRKNPIENTSAVHMSNLFYKYRDTRFVIFHGSFPYMQELTYLAKHYPNVYIDMSWMHIISPVSARQFLKEWLQSVPVNKIMAFGGDVSVEWAYGHSRMAREIVTGVLSEMVEEGTLTEAEAIEVAHRIMRDNAIDLFKLVNDGDCWRRRK